MVHQVLEEDDSSSEEGTLNDPSEHSIETKQGSIVVDESPLAPFKMRCTVKSHSSRHLGFSPDKHRSSTRFVNDYQMTIVDISHSSPRQQPKIPVGQKVKIESLSQAIQMYEQSEERAKEGVVVKTGRVNKTPGK